MFPNRRDFYGRQVSCGNARAYDFKKKSACIQLNERDPLFVRGLKKTPGKRRGGNDTEKRRHGSKEKNKTKTNYTMTMSVKVRHGLLQ